MGKNKLIKSHKGFTLVELLVTIAILSILATVSVIGFTSLIEKSTVSTDGHYVASLNNLLNIYKVGHRENIDEYELKEMLEKENITGPNIQSEKYGYTLYFNTQSQKFELSQEKLTGDKYIAINEDFFADTTTPDDSQGGLGDDENNNDVTSPSDGENDENSSESEPDLESEPNLVLQDFDKISYKKSTYIQGINGIIQVGIYIGDDFYSTILEISSINIVDTNSDCEWNVTSVEFDGKTHNNYIEFSECGVKTFSITVQKDGVEKVVDVLVYVINVAIKDAHINLDNHNPSVTVLPSTSDPSKYDFKFLIMENVVIQDYSQIYPQGYTYTWKTMSSSEKSNLLSKMEILITINDVQHNIDTINDIIDEDNKFFYIILESLDSNLFKNNCLITYRYQGENGLWVSNSAIAKYIGD